MSDTSASDVEFAGLAGTWRGTGVADYPTIDRVEYQEVLSFEWDSGRGVLAYEQRATLSDGSPSHRESGFLRRADDGAIELWNVQDNGRGEVLRGRFRAGAGSGNQCLELEGRTFMNDPGMVASRRVLEFDGRSLRYTLFMATATSPGPALGVHLEAELVRDA